MFSFLIKKEIDSRWNHQSPITNHQSPITNHQSPITNVLHIGFWDRFINFMRDLGKGTQLRIALVGGGVFVSLGITAFPITNNNGTSNSSATIKNNWTSNSKLSASDLNNNFSSIIETLGNIPNWTKNGSDTYYTAGRVGIGTSSPTERLHVSSSGALFTNLESTSTSGLNPNYIRFISGGLSRGYVGIEGENGTGLINGGQYAISLSTQYTNNLVLGTNATPRLTILGSSGNIGIGTTSPTSKLEVAGEVKSSSIFTGSITTWGGSMVTLNSSTSPGQEAKLRFASTFTSPADGAPRPAFEIASGYAAGAWGSEYLSFRLSCNPNCDTSETRIERMRITTGGVSIPGSLTVAGSNVTSDERLKKNIEPLSKNIDLISQLHPVKFQWKDSKAPGMKGIQYGFIAQEIEKIFPSLVVTDDRGYKAVSYISIVPMLVHSFQEQKSNQNQLGTEVELLANKMKKEKDEFSSKYSTLLDEQISLKRENIELKKQLSETQKQLTDLKKENADFKLSVMQQFKVLEENRYAKR
jgi:hypothetical protein